MNNFIIEDDVVMKYIGDENDVVIPYGVKDLFFESFVNDCITSVEIPGSILSVTCFVFENLINLKKVVINEGVQEIGVGAFNNCFSLEEIYLPKSIINVCKDAFKGCKSLKRIYYNGSKEEYKNIHKELNWNFDTNKYEVIFNL